jgi:hypothetical protein
MKAYLSQIFPFLMAALVMFIVYRRLRRSFGQQLLSPARMSVRIATLLIVGCLLLPIATRSVAFVGALLAGLTGGVLLALWGAARTRFLWTENKLYYVPHTYTGIAVSLLFLGRLVYRLIQVYAGMHTPHLGAGAPSDRSFVPASMVSSPLTLGLFFVLMGYYVCYYGVVLWKSRHWRFKGAEIELAQRDNDQVGH